MARFRYFPGILVLCALLLAPCLLLWRVVFSGDVFLPADLLRDIAPWAKPGAPPFTPWNPLHWDGMAEFYPWRLFAARTEHAGYLPLWNPHQFCGTPFLANAQSAVLYPLNVLFVLLPVKTAFGVSVLLHLFLTGTFLYAFLRFGSFRLTRQAALTGALCWQLSAWQVAWLALPTFLCTSAWFPLALLLTERAAQKPTAGRGAVLGAVLGVMLLAGHLQIAFYCVGMTVAYAVFCVAQNIRAGALKLGAITTATGVAIFIMACIALPQLLPSIELSRVSHRAGGHATFAGYAGYVRLAVPAINLVTLWLPQFFGSPTTGTYWGLGINGGPGAFMENAASVGALALLLACAGIVGLWKASVLVRFFGVAAIIALLIALGTPLNAVLYFGIPGWAQSGSPGRILVLWTLCTSLLAGVGMECVLEAKMTFASFLRSVGAWTMLLILSFGYTAFWMGRYAPAGALLANLGNVGDWWRAPVGIVLAGMAAFALWKRGSLSTRGTGIMLAILVAVEALASGTGFNRTARASDVYPVTPSIAFLQAHANEGRIMPINRRWSLNAMRPPPAVLPPNAATVYGLYDTQGYDSLLTRRFFSWAGELDNSSPAPPENGNMVLTNGLNSPLMQDANVRFLVSLGPLPPATSRQLIQQDGGTFVYEVSGRSQEVRSNPNRIRVFAHSDSVTVNEQWYPGWHAEENKHPVPLVIAHSIFGAVRLRDNNIKVVEVYYMPTAFLVGTYGLGLALLTLAALSTAFMTSHMSGRRRDN